MWNRSWTNHELALFSRKLGQLLEVGFPLLTSLKLVQLSCSKRMRKGIDTLVDELGHGKPFSIGLQKLQFPAFYCFLITAAEQHGRYTEAFLALDQYYEQRKIRRKRQKKVLFYPCLVLSSCFLTLLFFLHVLLPQFVSLYGSLSIEFPWITQQFLMLSKQWRKIYFYLLISLISTTLLFYYVLKKHRLVCEKMILHVPFLSNFLKTYLTAILMKQMGYLLESGIHILHVCDLFSQHSPWFLVRHSFMEIKKELLRGLTISKTLYQAPFLNPIAIQLISISEQTGTLSSTMIKLSKQLEEEHDHHIELSASALETCSLGVAGLFVFLIMIALFLPMFELIQRI